MQPDPKLSTSIGKRGRFHTLSIGSARIYADDDQLHAIAALVNSTLSGLPVGQHASATG